MADVILFPAHEVRRDWSPAKARVLAETDWHRRIAAEFKRRWQHRYRPLIACAWAHHVDAWRAECTHPNANPENAPWDLLWVTFLIRHPAARERRA